MSTTTVTATKTRKTSADYTRTAREKMREALAMAKKADALMREASRDELRAAEMKAKEKAAALAAKTKATKTAKPVIVTDGVGRKITLPATTADVFHKTCGKRRHGSFLLSSMEADDIVEALSENVSLTHGNFTVQFPRGNPLLFTVERDELLTWNTIPRARKTA